MTKIIYLSTILILLAGCEERETQTEKPISRYGSLIKVKKEYEERYIILHRNTFPGVLDRIYKSNIRNYSIFINEGILFSHFEYVGEDFDSDMAQMADPITRDWWKLTDPMQDPLPDRKEGEWWASMDLLYQLDTSKIAYKNAQRKAFVGTLNGNQEKILRSILDKINDGMVQKVLDHNIQNLTLYNHDIQIYLYIEYVGKDYQKDRDQLLKMIEVKSIYDSLAMVVAPQSKNGDLWEEMKEIFHTD
jgi:L-rhamnose mutarotase